MTLNAKIITLIETVLVIVLAAAVVIYAQVLWAQYMQQRSVVVIPGDTLIVVENTNDKVEQDEYTAAQRAKVAQDLAAPSVRPLPLEERRAVYDTLQATNAEPSMTDAERDAIIKSLNQ
jgi:hypothetical protein